MKKPPVILVIDDNIDDRVLCSRELQSAFNGAVKLLEASSGGKGIECAESHQPDCVLLDYSLPGKNGVEILKAIRSNHPHLPVIMLTGQGNEVVAVQSMKEGAQDYITKSQISAESLKRIISMAIERGELQKRICEQQASLEIFTRALAHDLKEPMRTICSFTGMILQNRQLPDKETRYFQYIQNASARMTMLIDTVFFYTQMDGYKKVVKEKVDMRDVLQEVRENLASIIRESGAKIVVGALPVVCANRVQMLQLWQNLIVNAIRHGGRGVQIRIGCDRKEDRWVFFVEDTGPGIEAKYLESIFMPFKRLSAAKEEGAGLGLAICRKIVELHEGKIWCESEPGKGTIFRFMYPGSQTDSSATKDIFIKEPRANAQGNEMLANVLLVDDRKSDIELVRIMLMESSGLRCNMAVASDGSEALDIMRREFTAGRPFDLVLLDINMPGMDGFEMLENMRRDDSIKGTAVIMCTGSTYNQDRERAKALGAVGYIVKPPVFEDVKPMLERIPNLHLTLAGEGYLLQRADNLYTSSLPK